MQFKLKTLLICITMISIAIWIYTYYESHLEVDFENNYIIWYDKDADKMRTITEIRKIDGELYYTDFRKVGGTLILGDKMRTLWKRESSIIGNTKSDIGYFIEVDDETYDKIMKEEWPVRILNIGIINGSRCAWIQTPNKSSVMMYKP